MSRGEVVSVMTVAFTLWALLLWINPDFLDKAWQMLGFSLALSFSVFLFNR